MDLTKEEKQIIIQALDNISIPVHQARDLVEPIIKKLKGQTEEVKTDANS